ncbi:MAG: TIM barrel protein [Planctomycetota bacterium]|jgi:deoxyribonuclease-4
MKEETKFGVAGCPPNFWKSSYKRDSVNSPLWLAGIGLDAYEIQFTHGIRLTMERALVLRKNAESTGTALSIHAPYYVVLTSTKKEVVKNSIEMMLKCLEFASYLGTNKIILHPGTNQGNARDAMKRCLDNLKVIRKNTDNKKTLIYVETVGRRLSYLGSLEEIIEMCGELDFLRPCLDFAHIYAYESGVLLEKGDFRKIFDRIGEKIPLGTEEMKRLHCHFYPIEFGEKGEKRHKNYRDDGYGPRFEPFLEVIAEYGLTPTIICESKDAQDEDALRMKAFYRGLQGGKTKQDRHV